MNKPKKFTKAWQLLEQVGWCQGASARASSGAVCSVLDPDASCFCASAAIDKVYGRRPKLGPRSPNLVIAERLRGALKRSKLAKTMFWQKGEYSVDILNWNDHPKQTKARVIKKLKELDI